jgi:PIN domain nuclease of toxin-antitoxin system
MTPQAVLLDTHVVLWAVADPGRLGATAELIADPGVMRYLSAVVVWEVAIKVSLGRLELGMPVGEWSRRAHSDLAAERLPVTEAHAAAVADLPMHHRDPFDRLLVAQARALGVPIATADVDLAAYDVEVVAIG